LPESLRTAGIHRGSTFPDIPSPRRRVIQAQEYTVVDLTQFVTQCVTVRKGAIDKSQVPEIRGVEAAPKFGLLSNRHLN